MIITLNTHSEYTPGTLIVDKNKGVYGIVLYKYDEINNIITYKIKSLNISKYWLIRKVQLFILKQAFK